MNIPAVGPPTTSRRSPKEPRWCPLATLFVVLVAAAGTAQGLGFAQAATAQDGDSSPAIQAPSTPSEGHAGPAVAPPTPESAGPWRFVVPLYDRFDLSEALADTIFLDGFYRTPASPFYDACLDRLAARLRDAGFGTQEGFLLEVIETPRARPAWWPIAGSLELFSGGQRQILLAFAAPGDAHRTMLPQGAPAAEVTGPIALSFDDIEPGSILVTRSPLSGRLLGLASEKGAACVLSASTFPFTIDPSGGDRHLDAIQFTKAPRQSRQGTAANGSEPRAPLAIGQISPRVLGVLQTAPPGANIRFHADCRTEVRPLRTLVATIVGSTRPEEAVAIASHIQEPGAGDNAAGASGLCQAAVTTLGSIKVGSIPRPARSLAFVFGDEMDQSRVWLRESKRTTVAALSADMLGQSPERTGSVALMERTPDPGALYTLPPDAHTPWGAGTVKKESLFPNGVNVVCREALRDVARHVGGWRTSENPWEGGSDHDVFNAKKIPAALMWHFTDFSYHTSLDRMGMIDIEELRRTCAAIVGAGLALADMRPQDVPRHLASNELERELRIGSARAAGNAAAEEAWTAWCNGCADWLERFAVK